jgi:hypothetical protein
MDLLVDLLNPEIRPKLERLREAVAGLKGNVAAHRVKFRDLPLGQGQILWTIKQVLAAYPDGLQAFEVQQIVGLELGRKLAKSTVNCALSTNTAFERIGRGRYRLRHSDQTP